MYNVYLIKTDIKVKANTFLNVSLLAEDLSDATSNASYFRYNGEELKKHIVNVELIISNVVRDVWNVKDLNPDYKEEGDKTMRVSEVIEKLNDALNEYGNIPVTMLISEIASEMNIEDIQADEESVTLCNF